MYQNLSNSLFIPFLKVEVCFCKHFEDLMLRKNIHQHFSSALRLYLSMKTSLLYSFKIIASYNLFLSRLITNKIRGRVYHRTNIQLDKLALLFKSNTFSWFWTVCLNDNAKYIVQFSISLNHQIMYCHSLIHLTRVIYGCKHYIQPSQIIFTWWLTQGY